MSKGICIRIVNKVSIGYFTPADKKTVDALSIRG